MMRHEGKSNPGKTKLQRAFAYWKKNRTWGTLENGWGWLIEKPERLTAISTLVISLATVVIVVVGFAQWSALHNTDVKIGRQLTLLEADQRPYVGITSDPGSPNLLTAPNGNHQMVWTFHFQNYGKTPANEVRVEHFYEFKNGTGFTPSFGNGGATNHSSLAPSQSATISVISPPITPEVWNELLNENRGISIAGTIHYKNVLGTEFLTRFCLGRTNLGSIGYYEQGDECRNEMK